MSHSLVAELVHTFCYMPDIIVVSSLQVFSNPLSDLAIPIRDQNFDLQLIAQDESHHPDESFQLTPSCIWDFSALDEQMYLNIIILTGGCLT